MFRKGGSQSRWVNQKNSEQKFRSGFRAELFPPPSSPIPFGYGIWREFTAQGKLHTVLREKVNTGYNFALNCYLVIQKGAKVVRSEKENKWPEK